MNIKNLLDDLTSGLVLDENEAGSLARAILQGELNDTQVAAILALLNTRPISTNEILGFRNAILEFAHIVSLDFPEAVDICGTGGDGKDTFNISTASAFVLAAMGYHVAKHGNVGVSSTCGSSDILTQLGVEFTADEDTLKRQIDEAGICFLHAPLFHRVLGKIAPIRKALGVKTIFNRLGPLLNPAEVKFQASGVFDMTVFRNYVEAFQSMGSNFLVLHSLDGYDEISLMSSCRYATAREDGIFDPTSSNIIGRSFLEIRPEDIKGESTLEDSKQAFVTFLKGEATPELNEVIACNAGFAVTKLYNRSFEDSFGSALEVITSGMCYKVLEKFLTV